MELLKIPKAELLAKLSAIIDKGWIHTNRSKNHGSVGNTLEDLLEIPENNLAIANTVDWELKTQRKVTSSLITLFHSDPLPRKPESVVAHVLLPIFGWKHKLAGKEHSEGEKSFRATLNGKEFSDRGFIIRVDSVERKIKLIFNPEKVNLNRHKEWLKEIGKKRKIQEETLAFWNFDDLNKKCAGKIRNAIFVIADPRIVNDQEEFKYEKIELLEDFAFNNFIRAIIDGIILVDFDARTDHNHGTKFRIKQNNWEKLFSKVTLIR